MVVLHALYVAALFHDAKWPVLQLCGQREQLDEKFHFFSSNLQFVHTDLNPRLLVHLLQAKRLEMIEKLLQKHEVKFSDGVLNVFDVVLASSP